ncbi:flagellar basal body-associated FliL family protein [bacterium]|nr:flagellar basal body-associated FliL family protein [bacterium]
MANLKQKINKLIKVKNIFVYLFALISSILTFLFFYVAQEVIEEKKEIEKEKDIYKIAKDEAIKLGRLEPDEKPIVKEIGPDGKVIIPTLSYADIGGMGENSNKSFWTNIPNSNSFISFDLAFSSYKGEMLMDFLTEYDVDFRKIVYDEISKVDFSSLEGSVGKKKLLENIKNEFNAYLDEKELDPIIFGVHFKKFAITTRG